MDFTTFHPPMRSDYDNVMRLNEAWLSCCMPEQPATHRTVANVPFLLFSLREQDIPWWQDALRSQDDWIDDHRTRDPARIRLQAAALGFVWQLADRNAYAARLISGASVAWCELLAAQPLVNVIDRVATREDLLLPRFDATALRSRPATHVALQSLLTQQSGMVYSDLPAAACALSAPSLRVAEKTRRE